MNKLFLISLLFLASLAMPFYSYAAKQPTPTPTPKPAQPIQPAFTPFVSVEIPVTSISLGQTVTGKMFLTTGLKGYNISSYDLDISFSQDVLSLAAVTPSTQAFDPPLALWPDPANGKIHLASTRSLDSMTQKGTLSGKIPLGTIAFRGKTAGLGSIQFSNVKVYSATNTQPISIETPKTSLTVVDSANGNNPDSPLYSTNPNTPYNNPNKCIENGIAGVKTDLGCIPTDPINFLAKFYGYGLSLIGGVALLLLIYSGYLILASQGNREMLGRGKKYIFYAISGLLLAIFGYLFIKIIIATILKVPGFN